MWVYMVAEFEGEVVTRRPVPAGILETPPTELESDISSSSRRRLRSGKIRTPRFSRQLWLSHQLRLECGECGFLTAELKVGSSFHRSSAELKGQTWTGTNVDWDKRGLGQTWTGTNVDWDKHGLGPSPGGAGASAPRLFVLSRGPTMWGL
ncbi:unnamed protein product [Pleuronectes platessa]|uniref:Uncharacterized protein n=1 Tax=Pleuronectes platessa TaxID=8262 RepID=A0A9N7UUE6_PLEPL|nr:unnamed protein product [Pleuronectes platessa]